MPKTHGNEKFLRALGEAIYERRKQLGWSQDDLSDASGINRAFICNIEHGIRNPSTDTLLQLAKGLGIKLSTLIARAENSIK